MAGGIFISYRRDDARHAAGRLVDRLEQTYAREQLFFDIDNIAPGLDFVRVLSEQVQACDVLLAVIGQGWLDARNEDGSRRLGDPKDFVRIEIEAALARDIRVVPVLVDGAPMPREVDLPEKLQPLARRNAGRLTHERFGADAEGLAEALTKAVPPKKKKTGWFGAVANFRALSSDNIMPVLQAAQRAHQNSDGDPAKLATPLIGGALDHLAEPQAPKGAAPNEFRRVEPLPPSISRQPVPPPPLAPRANLPTDTATAPVRRRPFWGAKLFAIAAPFLVFECAGFFHEKNWSFLSTNSPGPAISGYLAFAIPVTIAAFVFVRRHAAQITGMQVALFWLSASVTMGFGLALVWDFLGEVKPLDFSLTRFVPGIILAIVSGIALVIWSARRRSQS